MLARSGSLFALVLLFVPLSAQAQEDAAGMAAESGGGARELFMRGQVAYSQGDYETSLELWRQAYALDPRPLLQWNISQACERLGQLQEAADALELYLAGADPSDEHQADARARLAALRERLASTGILLRGGPDGAVIGRGLCGYDHKTLESILGLRSDAVADKLGRSLIDPVIHRNDLVLT